MQFREAEPSDIPDMARVRALDRGTEEFWVTRISAYMNGEHHPQQALTPRILYVAIESENLVGFVAGHLTRRFNCSGELEWISVLPEYRKKGIASGLLHLLAAWFVENKSLRICVDVDPDNSSAQQFYRKHGAENLNRHWLVWNDIREVMNK